MIRVVVVGDAGLDIVVRTPALPEPGGDARAVITDGFGGAGANTAAWLAACGAAPVLFSRVGTDPAAGLVRSSLAEAGVECRFAVDPAAPTCRVVVLVDDSGQRTMLADRGAAGLLAPGDIVLGDIVLGDIVLGDIVLGDIVLGDIELGGIVPGDIELGDIVLGGIELGGIVPGDIELGGIVPGDIALAGAGHLHLSGYVLLDPSSAAGGRAALAAARAAGLTTSVDPQAAALLADPVPFLAAIDGVDLLLPSAGELAALGSAAALLDRVGAIAVTAGAAGASWIDRSGTVHVPAETAPVVDSTGAGDAFDAGLLTAWLSGAPPAAALRAGAAAGARAVSRPGARPPRPRTTR